ncbi:hypothetical protein [Vibrio parahaemolyticus]|uniref:hypothetical protein n=1 Tax=Vibrio parahaemolyticus TaxID=670 RepID=UPI0012681EEF|nr:hypothetical protein [Vibrio parahaemolyticus]MBD6984266.1 hypothetical protein [Vibrio parahaemolyticus]MBD6989370.1 hypothetical protein [Vibrio parahaemolyticus]
MKTMVDNNTFISSEVDYLKKSVEEFRANLNAQGVWLFLATLGCWSVQGKGFQLAAITITFYIFTFQALPPKFRRGQSILLKNDVTRLRSMVNRLEISDDDKHSWFVVIDMLNKERFSYRYAFKASHFFYVSYVFLLFTTFKLVFDFNLPNFDF